ncbi:MAG: BACON domain-containing protein [Kiritimatiellae bacterium]|nr:BACON domain-containing protein [Kiritimatiellia bacterium]
MTGNNSLFFVAAACGLTCCADVQSNVFRLDPRGPGSFGASLASGVETVGAPDGSMSTAWDTSTAGNGWTELSSDGETVSLFVENEWAVEGGRLTEDTCWDGGRVLRCNVHVPAGVTLALANGARLVFTEGVRVVVEPGGSLLAHGAEVVRVGGKWAGRFAGKALDDTGGEAFFDDATAETLRTVRFVSGTEEVAPPRVYTSGAAYGELPAPSSGADGFLGWHAQQGAGIVAADDAVPPGTSSLSPRYGFAALELDKFQRDVGRDGETFDLCVGADGAWTASADDSWLSVSAESGTGDASLSVVVEPNEGAPRTATVHVVDAAGAVERTCVVSQAAGEGVAPPPDPGSDADGDGLTAAQEAVAGTDPDDPDSVFRVLIRMEGSLPVVTWEPDIPGARTYRIQGKPRLSPDVEWQDVPEAEVPLHRFFRAVVELEDGR